MLVRPVADIASFPAPGWTTAPLWDVVNSEEPDDTTFITALAPGAQDPQVALQIGDLEIPYGATGQVTLRIRMRWSAALTAAPATVRVGLSPASLLGVTDPVLAFERSLVGFSGTDFDTMEITFQFEDWAGDASAYGVYLEMTPDAADVTQFGEVSWLEVESNLAAVVVGTSKLGTTTAQQVITEARDHHPSFEKRAQPNGTLLRLLSSYQREITAKIARVNPALVSSPVTCTLPLADFDDGITLPSHSYLLPGVEARLASDTDVVETVELVNVTLRKEGSQMFGRYVYLQGNKLFLSGRAENWGSYASLTLQMVLVPKELTRLDDVLVLPDWGMDAYVGSLVTKMAVRSGLDGTLLSQARDMEQQFLDTVAQQKGAETSHTRDVFGGF